MTRKIQLISQAVWQYLNQPIGYTHPESVWEVQRFWYLYQIQLLETCLEKDINSETHYTSDR